MSLSKINIDDIITILINEIEDERNRKGNKYISPPDVRYAILNLFPSIKNFYNKSAENSDEIMGIIHNFFEKDGASLSKKDALKDQAVLLIADLVKLIKSN